MVYFRYWIVIMALACCSKTAFCENVNLERHLLSDSAGASDSLKIAVNLQAGNYCVELKEGIKVKGKIESFDDSSLTVKTDNGQQKNMRWSDILSVRRITDYKRIIVFGAVIFCQVGLCCLCFF